MFRDDHAVGEKSAKPPKRKARLPALSEEEVRSGLLALAHRVERRKQEALIKKRVPDDPETARGLRDLQRQIDLMSTLRFLYEGWKEGASHQAIIETVRDELGDDEATVKSDIDFLLKRHPILKSPVEEAVVPKPITSKKNHVPQRHRQPILDAFARCANDEEMAKELGFSALTIKVYRGYLGLKRPRADLLKKIETMPAQEETNLADQLEAKKAVTSLHPAP